ncbi:hypothetical protein FWK35_00014012 [Aphis craccivora]|uniref:Uncharacterized protein n=1 Tax=Aphis craccivora TaxID=307492 RepID=A0A6G0Z5Y8_APHCR|nr:hypothetical protein FWK35_00014012 [Aphis craccivora]
MLIKKKLCLCIIIIFFITIRITYEELCIKFNNILIFQKNCHKNRKFLCSINNSKKVKIFRKFNCI